MEPPRAIDEEKAKAALPAELSTKELLRAQTLLYHRVNGFFGDMSLKCAMELGIFDAIDELGGGPVTLSELSGVLTAIHPSKLVFLPRLMRLLTQLGFFVTHAIAGREGFVLTPLSKILVKKNKTGMADFVRFMYLPFTTQPLYRFSNWFQGPAPTTFQDANGRPFWESIKEDPEKNRLFNEAMAGDSSVVMKAIVTDCRDVFEGVGSLVDVGGGTGVIATAIAKAFPEIKCMVLDLPHVVAEAIPESSGKVDMIAGDMFQHIPPADAVFLKQILHDWNDDDCVKILRKCREAVPPNGGKVVVLDEVVGSDKNDKELLETQLLHDMGMLMFLGSSEREVEEWESLFLRAGFSSFKIKHNLVGLCMVHGFHGYPNRSVWIDPKPIVIQRIT